MYDKKRKIMLFVICGLIITMSIGFALLSQNLTITGTSSIDSNWNIRITNIRVKNTQSAYNSGSNASGDVSGSTGCTVNTVPCNSTEANFETKLITPGDYIIYEVTVTNSGNLDGVVSSINLSCSENSAINCTATGLERADTIAKNGGTNTIDVITQQINLFKWVFPFTRRDKNKFLFFDTLKKTRERKESVEA